MSDKLHPAAIRAAERFAEAAFVDSDTQSKKQNRERRLSMVEKGARIFHHTIEDHLKSEGYNDPKYLYAGKRIERVAIECRNAEIDQLRKEARERLKSEGWEELREAAEDVYVPDPEARAVLMKALRRVRISHE